MNILTAKRFDSSEGDVWKYVFEFPNAITESVLYRYESFENRTVLCVSVQSGCPVGCQFCGSGGQFIRNLTTFEIIDQIEYVLKDQNIESINSTCAKFQIMFMSMGEPFLNYQSVKEAIQILARMYPNADLLVSTIAPNKPKEFTDFLFVSNDFYKVGLQFSIHESNDIERNKLIPYSNKLSLWELRNYGLQWWKATNRKPYCNYCIHELNATEQNFNELRTLFPPNVFAFTFSVICSNIESMKDAGYKNIEKIRNFENLFQNDGYDTRIFNPAGQDDIGGGCGQLFHVQRWMKEYQKDK
jgi:23S rRNA (adenine2503-C2)-methyltransferase